MRFGFLKKLKNGIKSVGKKITGIGGKLYKTTSTVVSKILPISKTITSIIPGGQMIEMVLDRLPKWYETNGKTLTEISEGKKIKDVIKDYGKTLYNDVILNKNNTNHYNLSSLSPFEQQKLTK
ncbi:hypothetical protein EDI_066130 [Entamoeba dispar SAW760]|uniref:Uncharacterized protein n=1 Tax=Entamoeba dispar (strain ATCC PRA-260 / SAW760) TaxID=370354 RepID=B0EUM9_ENTDS|nr:uncharacterized protein EDI_066130 [Entamoeba dispar SAW760]EDR21768.1 hypothetical protein EDI_066130 [Entamoeba dispar SAW760]|eukprot:EDR21768.1 hypothetical protein EDI_066130 [Entamoeba dispar SAW760]